MDSVHHKQKRLHQGFNCTVYQARVNSTRIHHARLCVFFFCEFALSKKISELLASLWANNGKSTKLTNRARIHSFFASYLVLLKNAEGTKRTRGYVLWYDFYQVFVDGGGRGETCCALRNFFLSQLYKALQTIRTLITISMRADGESPFVCNDIIFKRSAPIVGFTFRILSSDLKVKRNHASAENGITALQRQIA